MSSVVHVASHVILTTKIFHLHKFPTHFLKKIIFDKYKTAKKVDKKTAGIFNEKQIYEFWLFNMKTLNISQKQKSKLFLLFNMK